LFKIGESAQLKFAPKKFRAKFCRFWRISSKPEIFCLDIGRNSPKSKQIRPQIMGRNLTALIRPFSGEQELLCKENKDRESEI
jgi:hypothetical protein